jgi:RHS repeat-associated protein
MKESTPARRRRHSRSGVRLSGVVLALVTLVVLSPADSRPQDPTTPAAGTGQTATLLPDGRWLLLGGQGLQAIGTALIADPQTGALTRLSQSLLFPRAHHSATMLPDGTVLVFGGLGVDGRVVGSAERFLPETQRFEPLSTPGLSPRAFHTATLLTDGRVLVAGGTSVAGEIVANAQLWESERGLTEPQSVPLRTPRHRNTATLLADGRVLLWGGVDRQGMAVNTGEMFDPTSRQFTTVASPPPAPSSAGPLLEASLPTAGATDVPVETRIALRFSTLIGAPSLTASTVILSNPASLDAVSIVPAEGGRLVFVTPQSLLRPGTSYTLTLNGATDLTGGLLPLIAVPFSTAPPVMSAPGGAGSTGSAAGGPGAGSMPLATRPEVPPGDTRPWDGQLRDGRPYSSWQALPPKQGEPGGTALAGQVLALNGEPLADVTLTTSEYGAPSVSARTDETGRFLLAPLSATHHAVLIDGRSANRSGRTYGVFEVGVDLLKGETNVLPYTIWMPRIDTEHAVTIPVPTTREVVVTTALIPGLEVRIPPGSTITDSDGRAVRQVSITPIPLDRPPFPLPTGVDVPLYFTVQPGAGYLTNASWTGARLIYPNSKGAQPGTPFNFWNYDADAKGWYVYGQGKVTTDGRQIVPNPGVAIYEFTGAMVAAPNLAPAVGPKPGGGATDGEPVDLGTGLFVYGKTDLVLPDVLPIVLTRTYRPLDTVSRAFGIGTTHPYDMFLVGTTFPYTYVDVILPDGGHVHYDRISPGTQWWDAVYECTTTPTAFYKTRIAWEGSSFVLRMKDGTAYTFKEDAGAARPMQGGLLSIVDRYGNTLNFTRNSDGDLTQITSPSGRTVTLTYDTTHRVTQARDNSGRTVSYVYDASGRLSTVTDAAGGVTTYIYDAQNEMLTIRDPRNVVYLTNQYDGAGRVSRQTQADGTTYQFAYTLDVNGAITETDVTDPRGNVRRVTFNSDGYPVSDVRAAGTVLQQTTTYTRQTGTDFILSVTDPLNRQTSYTYDNLGNVLTVTRLSGTPNAVTTTLTYQSAFQLLTSVTDPLGHRTTFAYDSAGNLTTATNPLSQATTFTYNSAGQPVTAADPLGDTAHFSYQQGLLATMTNPLGKTMTKTYDSAGRAVSVANPLGRLTAIQYDPLNQVTRVMDARAGVTQFSRDPNGNLLSVTDARGSVTSYVYNSMDRATQRTDPLLRAETYTYDNAGNPAGSTDRKGQVTQAIYDGLNRLSQLAYADQSTTTYIYDAGNRVTLIVDSVGGTITRTYDLLDRLTQETTAQGSVSYAYDAAGRRTSMTPSGQAPVTYAYDNVDRLTQVTQGLATVTLAYDAAGRRTSLTLPNGVVTAYAYDVASQLTGLTYTNGPTVLGTLTYAYDKAGNRIKTGGTWAGTGLPAALASATYDAANELTTWGGGALTYDLNGNLTGDPTLTYTWNARNQLVGLTGSHLAATLSYDGTGRRNSRTMNGTTTTFLYDTVNPVQEATASNTTTLLTGLGVDEPFIRTGSINLLTDVLGSTVALADSSATVRTTYTYEPFGTTTASGAIDGNPYQFTGRENDGAGLYFYRARYYSPVLQRFIGEDPIGFLGGDVNFYTYVSDRPLNLVDPFGLSSLVYNAQTEMLTVISGNGQIVGTFPAANNAQTGSRGAWPAGTYDYSYLVTHRDDAPDSAFGAYGNFVFAVSGCAGCGVHSGRANIPDRMGRTGPQHATKGCIRTTDLATSLINQLNNSGDPLRTLTVAR